jgi:DNA polymerase-3 subunit alpha
MKANFPAIYMSAVLTADSGDIEKIAEIIAECRRMQIPILPPDINESYSQFTVIKGDINEKGERDPDRIRFGLVTIKNFGQGIASAIIEERKKNGPYKSLSDFLDRVKDRNLNKKSLEALIKVGGMDLFGIDRGTLMGNIEGLLAYNKEQEKKPSNQDSLFLGMADTSSLPKLKLHDVPLATPSEKLTWEKELLGLYISGHPLDKYKHIIAQRDMNIAKAKETLKDGQETVIAAIIEEAKPITTKKGDMMMFLKVADFTGTLEAVVFPRTFNENKHLFVPDVCIAIKGKMSERNGGKSIIIDRVKRL